MIDTSLPDAKSLRAALGAEIRKIRKTANWLLVAAVVIWAVLVGGAYLITGSLDNTAKLSTTAAYFVLFGWGSWFVYAYFLRMEAKQDIALELLMRSFAMANESNKVLNDVKNKVDPIVTSVQEMTGDVKKVITDVSDVAHKVRATVDQYAETGNLAQGFLKDAKQVFATDGNGFLGKVVQELKELKEAFTAPPRF